LLVKSILLLIIDCIVVHRLIHAMHTTVMDLNQTLVTNQLSGQRTGMDGMNKHVVQGN